MSAFFKFRVAALVVTTTGATLLGVGCNSVLGNEPGELTDFADSSTAMDADAAVVSDALVFDGAAGNEKDADIDAGPETCVPGKKSCNDVCVSKSEAVFGCSGASCLPCSLNHATAVCSGAGCSIGSCDPGYADCDQQAANGCETDLSQAAHCGSCNAVCGNTAPYCQASGSTFGCTTGCTGGGTLCGTQCSDLTSSPTHCGTCENSCPGVGNGQVRCQSSQCSFTCNPGFHVCSSLCASNADPATCGASCAPCSVPTNGTATCNGVSCDFTCKPGFHRCGNTCADNTDVATCGASCSTCPVGANATATCDGTACGLTCSAGFNDCDKKPDNGCEVDLTSDTKNCGSCGVKCKGPERCSAGVCVPGKP